MEDKRYDNITVSSAPHIRKLLSTRSVMIDVIIGLVPAMAAAGYYFRIYALILICTCVLSAVATEWLCNLIRKKPNLLGDFSAVVTGIILALSLPPSLPVWAAIIGSVFAVAIDGKMARIAPENIAAEDSVQVRTQATPLWWSKKAIKDKNGAKIYNEQQFEATFTGEVGGCLGETSGIALLIGGLYLLIRRTINPSLPLAVLVSAFVFAAIAYLIDSDAYVQPVFHLTSGAMLLCAFFIATDPVTVPLTTKGMWIFGIGVGAITMLIRIVGEYPEGVMYAVLLMNAVTPLIDRFCKLVPAGGKPSVK